MVCSWEMKLARELIRKPAVPEVRRQDQRAIILEEGSIGFGIEDKCQILGDKSDTMGR